MRTFCPFSVAAGCSAVIGSVILRGVVFGIFCVSVYVGRVTEKLVLHVFVQPGAEGPLYWHDVRRAAMSRDSSSGRGLGFMNSREHGRSSSRM